jgi:hypothetical protein
MFTADGVEIVHNLRVWTVHLVPCTADLQSRATGDVPSGWFHGRTDTGSAVMVEGCRAAVVHPATGKGPPVLGRCRWIATCDQDAVRMQPHRLMSPVPTCARCIETFELR